MPHRVLATIATLVVSAWAAGPACAAGGPLLSGYGGPGEGAQAILGSTLIGGSGENPGAGPSGGGGASVEQQGVGALAGPAAGAGEKARAKHSSTRRTRGGHDGHVVGPGAGRVQTPQRGSSQPERFGLAAAQGDAGSQPLGISGEDFVYMLAALALLAFIGALTRSLARRPFR